MHQQARVHARMEEVRAVKTTVEREAQMESEEILQRLKSTESLKLMQLQRDKDEFTVRPSLQSLALWGRSETPLVLLNG